MKFSKSMALVPLALDQCMGKNTRQSLSQRSKTRTNNADPGSASGATFLCMQFLPFFIYFFIPVLSRSYFTSMTPDKDQKIEQLFYFLLVRAPQSGDIHELRSERFCACRPQALEIVPRAKSG